MAKPKKVLQKGTAPKSQNSKPKYPYTITIGALRKVLQEIPKRPKPPKVNFSLIQSWGIHDNNARTIFSVLRELGLIDSSDAPSEHYVNYMRNDVGGISLANRIREKYSELFQSSHEPYKESQENLKNFFNIHSGGGERTIQFQISTFKTLCEFADFSAQQNSQPPAANQNIFSNNTGQGAASSNPIININLHIHLPENKARADYEEIIKDIAKYIYDK